MVKLSEQYAANSKKYAATYKKRLPYLIGLTVLILALSYVNTFESARPVTMPILMVLMVALLIGGVAQDGAMVKSYHDENIAMKLRKSGRERVGLIRSILWRPFVLLTVIIVVGLAILYWVSGGTAFTTPYTSP
jgi:hypothetical protein